MKKLLILTGVLLLVSGCNSDISEMRKSITSINLEVKRTVDLYEKSKEVSESLEEQLNTLLTNQSLLSNSSEYSEQVNPLLESLYVFYSSYVEEKKYASSGYGDSALENSEVKQETIEPETLTNLTKVRYYYDDVSNILEQMFITSLPNGNTFFISLEWYKGELIKHEEMVSY